MKGKTDIQEDDFRKASPYQAGRTEAGGDVTIQSVQLFPITTSRLYGEPSQHIVIRVTSNDGHVGWGEISDISHLPALMPDTVDLEKCLRVLLVNRPVTDLNGAEDAMLTNYPGTRFYGKASLVRAGVSIALHDLKARVLGISIAELLGGRRRDKIKICYPIFRMNGREDVADRVELVRRQFDLGFRSFRLYIGHGTADEELLDSLFGLYGEKITLTSLDGSGLSTLPAFLRHYRCLTRFPFESIESPVDRDDIEAMAEARRSIDHPVSEHVRSPEYAIRLIRARAVDIFNISITVAGGIQGMLRLFELAVAANIECLIGTTQELSIATAAQAQVGSIAPRLDYASDPVGPSLYCADVTSESVRFEDGYLLVPDGPGLGVEGSMEKINKLIAPLSSVNEVQTGYSRG